MTIEELIVQAHETALAKGWWNRSPSGAIVKRDIGEQVCLFHSEVSEALEAFRDPHHKPHEIWWVGEGGKPEGVGIELGDVLIRMADSCGAYKIDLGDDFLKTQLSNLFFEPSFAATTVPGLLCQLHGYLTDLGRKWQYNVGFPCLLNDMWKATFNFTGHIMRFIYFGANSIDSQPKIPNFIDQCVAMKLSYNKSRSYRHGDKRC